MSTEQAMRDGEIARTNPPYVLIDSELCDGANGFASHELDPNEDTNYRWVRIERRVNHINEYLCADCTRERIRAFYKKCRPGDLLEPAGEYYAAERCQDCHLYRCDCERI